MPRSSGHPATRMSPRPAQVQPLQWHTIIRRADHRPRGKQLVEPHLPVKNIAPDQPEPPLEIQRRVNLPPDHRLGESRRMGIDGRDDRVRRRLALIVPAPPRPQIIAEMLAEQARHMLPLRRQAVVQRRRDQHLDNRLPGPAILPRIKVGVIHIGEARRHDDPRRQMIPAPRQDRETRQPVERDIHPEGRAFAGPPLEMPLGLRAHRPRRHQPLEQQPRVDVRHHRRRPNRLAARDHSDRAILLDDHLVNRRVEQDIDPRLSRRACHRLGDRPHPADRMAPRPRHSGGLTKQVMQQHIGRPRRVGRGKIAHHPVEPEQRFGQITREVPVEDIPLRPGRIIVKDADLVGRHPDHVASQAEQRRQPTDPAARPRRRSQQPLLDQRHHCPELGEIAIIGRPVFGMMTNQLGSGQPPATAEQIRLLTGQEIVDLAQHDLQSVPLEFEVADHRRVEQAHRIARRRIPVPRNKLVGHRCPANGPRRLEDRDVQPLLRQIGCTDEPVMPRADN